MKKTIFATLGAVALFCFCQGQAQAQMLVVGYNFNDGGASGAQATATTLASTSGTGSNISTNFPAANTVVFAGTTKSAVNNDVAGNALSLQGGTGAANNGDYIQFTISTAGLTGLTLGYATQTSSATTGFTTQALSYSTNGTTFTNISSLTPIPTSFASESFALPTGAENQASLTLRLVFTGATTATSNNRIDNLTVQTIPEPSTYAAMALGSLCMFAVLRARRRTA